MNKTLDDDPSLRFPENDLGELYDRFESAWKHGPPPTLETYLAEVPEWQQSEAFEELLAVELEYRFRRQEGPLVEEYAARFPGVAAQIGRIFAESRLRAEEARRVRVQGSGSQPHAPLADAEAVAGAAHSGPDDAVRTATASQGSPLPIGVIRYFGDYELLEEIGRGGMGMVFKARQQSLHRIVTVKMILPQYLDSPARVERFHREAEAAASLKHPNIVAIHEVGEHDGRYYFSMDYVEGRNLADVVRESPLSSKKAARYLEKVAQAVHYAHKQGTIHRDLKPSNILIDGDDETHITDFGLAKRPQIDSKLSLDLEALGSPSYMPPEQVDARHGEVGPSSDVYALGATLYDLLTGRPPFRAETPVATMHLVLHSEPVPPRMLNETIDRDLETICLKCLAKDPDRRYASAEALAQDLGRYLRNEPIHARPTGRTERFWRWCRRNPLVASLTVALLTGLLGGLIVVTTMWLAVARERDRAEKNYLRVFAAVDELYTKSSRDPAIATVATRDFRVRLLAGAARQYEQFVVELGEDTKCEQELARAYLRLGQIYPDSGPSETKPSDAAESKTATTSSDRAAIALRKAIAIQEKLVERAPESPSLLEDLAIGYEHLATSMGTLNPYSSSKPDASKIKERQRLHSLALHLREQLFRRFPENRQYQNSLAYSYLNMGQTLADGNKHADAMGMLDKAKDLLEKLSHLEPANTSYRFDLAHVYDSLAETCWRSGRVAQASGYQEKATDIKKSLWQGDLSQTQALAQSKEHLANRRYKDGQLEQAQVCFEESVEFFRKALDMALQEKPEVKPLRIELARTNCELFELSRVREVAEDRKSVQKHHDRLCEAQALVETVLRSCPQDADALAIQAACKEWIPELAKRLEEVSGPRPSQAQP